MIHELAGYIGDDSTEQSINILFLYGNKNNIYNNRHILFYSDFPSNMNCLISCQSKKNKFIKADTNFPIPLLHCKGCGLEQPTKPDVTVNSMDAHRCRFDFKMKRNLQKMQSSKSADLDVRGSICVA